LWAALHYALGTRTLKEDLAHAEEQCQGSPVATAAAFDPVKA
jgi:hypothetical protein